MSIGSGRFKLTILLLSVIALSALLARTMAKVDANELFALLRSLDTPHIVLLICPASAALLCDVLGWRRVLLNLSQKSAFLQLLRVRLSAESISLTMPGGVISAESAVLLLLSRAGVSVGKGTVAILGRKYLLIIAQSLFVLLVTAWAWEHSSLQFPGKQAILLAAGGGLALVALGSRVLLSAGNVARALRSALEHIPIAKLRVWLKAQSAQAAQVDATLVQFFSQSAARTWLLTLPFAAVWWFEALETYVILRLFGFTQSPAAAAEIEVIATLVRNMVFLLPAGMGAQDLTYVSLVSTLQPDGGLALGTALVIMKRGREMLWAALGYCTFLGARRRAPVSI